MSEPYKILELLPSLHSGILAILGAFIISWYTYVFNESYKISTKAKELILKNLMLICPTTLTSSPINIPLGRNGLIDNKQLAQIINELQMKTQLLSKSEIKSMEDLEAHLNNVLNLVVNVISTPPFYGDINYLFEMPHIEDIRIPSIEECYYISAIMGRLLFSLKAQMQNLEEIQNIINKEKSKQHHDLFTSFVRDREIEVHKMAYEEIKNGIPADVVEKNVRKELEIIKSRAEERILSDLNSVYDYYSLIKLHYNNLIIFSDRFNSEIQDSIYDHERKTKKYQVKNITNRAIRLISFIMFFGICIPLFVLGPIHPFIPWENIITKFLAHLLCIVTIFPYFLALSNISDTINKNK